MQGLQVAENTTRGGVKTSGWQTMQGDGAAEDTTCSSPFLSKGAAVADDLMDDLMEDGRWTMDDG
jgi:hypothetical protein